MKIKVHFEDIYDGEIYKLAQESVLVDEYSISLMWYTDSVELYESSSYSLWPFYFVINELPPEERFKPENLIMVGLWGSKSKPHPNVFLKHTYHQLEKLRNGIEVQIGDSGEKRFIKVILLCGTCDTPARASFMNLKTHSGFHSCPQCLTEGEKSKRTGDVTVFPFEEELELRSSASYEEHVRESVRTKSPCQGVKGPSLLSFMLYFCILKTTSIDVMHAVYMGIVKQLLNLWFNPHYSKSPFSLSKHTKAVNDILFNLRLPHFVQRFPVAVDKLSFWKASLLRNFFFYFMLPILKVFMSAVYYEHLTLLVEAISLLNGSSISHSDILKADELLCKFVKDFENLYGLRHMSFNIHLLRHLGAVVRNLGPLWVTSCFGFEDLNGKLADLAFGNKDAALQIGVKMKLFTNLHIIIDNMSASLAKDYCEFLTKIPYN